LGGAAATAGLHAAKIKKRAGLLLAINLRVDPRNRMGKSCFMERMWFLLFKGYDGSVVGFVPYEMYTLLVIPRDSKKGPPPT
jgi:hypothetical protein